MKDLGEKALAFLISLLLLAILGEAGLRLSGALRLAAQRRLGDAVLQKKNGYRILCLGESTTAGQYPALLQQRLDRAGGDSAFAVIDGGVAGAHSSFILSRLKDNLDHYRPDMVVVMMGINDPPTLLPPPYRPSWDSRLKARSKVYKLFSLMWHDLLAKRESKKLDSLADAPGGADPAPVSSKLSKEELYLLSNFTDAGPAAGHEDPLFVDEAGVSTSYRAFIQAARRHVLAQDLIGAERCLSDAISLNPYEIKAYRFLGDLYARQRRYDDIWTLFMEGLRVNPNETIVFFFFVNSLSRLLRDDPRARERFERASRAKDSSLAGHLLLYAWNLQHGRAGAATQTLKGLLARDPDQARLYATLGRRCLSQGRRPLAERYFARAEAIRLGDFNAMLYGNYQKLIAELSARRIHLVCMQYPMRSIEPLKKMLRQNAGILFVDNERIFKDAVERDGYERYFNDDFGGDFGHCTREGNRLLAEHLAEAILAYRRRGRPLPEP